MLIATAALLLVTACGGGSSADSGTVGPGTKSIRLTIETASLSVYRGLSATVPVTVERLGGYTGVVSFATSTQPDGVSVLLIPGSLSGQATSASMVLSADNGATSGSSTFTLTATGTGVSSASASVPLTIIPPSIGVAIGNAAIVVPQGSNTALPVVVTRQGYTGSIILSVIDLQPPTVVATLSPQSLQLGSAASQLTISTSTAQPIGTFSFTVRATGVGVAPVTVAIPVTVTESVAPRFTLAVLPTSVSIKAGTMGRVLALIGRTLFSGDIALSLDGAPAGVTGTFAKNPDTSVFALGNELTLSVAANATPGTYAMSIRGVGTGVENQVAMMTLVVTP